MSFSASLQDSSFYTCSSGTSSNATLGTAPQEQFFLAVPWSASDLDAR